MNRWPSGFPGCHGTAHKPGSGCEDGSIATQQTQRALHHGRQHWMSVKSRSPPPLCCLRSPVHARVRSARGNTTVCGEFNFTADPEAAYVVLKEYQCPTYLACWEFTCHSKLSWVRLLFTHRQLRTTIVPLREISRWSIGISLCWQEFCDAWLAQDTSKAHFMAKIFQYSMEMSKTERFQKEFVAGSGFISCDSYAMAAAIDDSFILESDCYPVSVELTGTHTRGMMVLDTVGFLKTAGKVFIIKKVDMGKFEQMMMAALK